MHALVLVGNGELITRRQKSAAGTYMALFGGNNSIDSKVLHVNFVKKVDEFLQLHKLIQPSQTSSINEAMQVHDTNVIDYSQSKKVSVSGSESTLVVHYQYERQKDFDPASIHQSETREKQVQYARVWHLNLLSRTPVFPNREESKSLTPVKTQKANQEVRRFLATSMMRQPDDKADLFEGNHCHSLSATPLSRFCESSRTL